MNYSFNLLDKKWIPCIMPDGIKEELSITDTLFKAENIKEIHDSNPLVTISLYRLLLAILHRNFGPEDYTKWKKLWNMGRFDQKILSDYFKKWHDRFDLFDKKYPFYQTPGLPEKYFKSIAKINFQADNNATLFDHSNNLIQLEMSPAKAAQLILAFQSFDVGGTKSDKGENGSADASLLNTFAVGLIKEETLFRTLLLNLHIYNADNEIPYTCNEKNDMPPWENNNSCKAEKRTVSGLIDWLTWQSRRVLIRPQMKDGNTVVNEVAIAKGWGLNKNQWAYKYETMATFYKNPKPKDKQSPWPPVGFSLHKKFWRNSYALFQNIVDVNHTSRIMKQLEDIKYEQDVFQENQLFVTDYYGLINDQAKILTLCEERLPLPLSLLGNEKALKRLATSLDLAEKIAVELRKSIRKLTSYILREDKPDSVPAETSNAVADSFYYSNNYWNTLETPFKKFIVDVSQKESSLTDWFDIVSNTARNMISETADKISANANLFKAKAKAESFLNHNISKIKETLN